MDKQEIELKKQIDLLVDMACKTKSATESMQLSQAALNVAHVLATICGIKRHS